MHYYQFNIGDYIKHTSHLTPMEDITYRRLLDLYYDTEMPITQNNPAVSRRLRVPVECVETILNEFFKLTDIGWINPRADAEIAAYRAFNEKQKANGKKGGRPKKTQPNPGLSQGKPKKTLNKNQKPLTINQEPSLKDSSPNGDVSTPDGDRRPPVPHEKIIELYHEIFPAAPQVLIKLWGGTRKKHLQARWNEDKSRQDVDWWRDFFLWASYSSFLTGKVKPSGGRDAPFMADLGWIIKPENFVKIYEGKYHDLNDIARHERDHGGAK